MQSRQEVRIFTRSNNDKQIKDIFLRNLSFGCRENEPIVYTQSRFYRSDISAIIKTAPVVVDLYAPECSSV